MINIYRQILQSFFLILLLITWQVDCAIGKGILEVSMDNKFTEKHFEQVNDESIVTYPVPSCYQVNSEFTMQVKSVNSSNWIDVPLIDHITRGELNCTYGNFYTDDSVMVKINKNSSISNFSISPKSFNIEENVDDSSLVFILSATKYLMINIDGTDILSIADPVIHEKPADSGPAIFNVTLAPYNADNTGTTVVTDVIQQAIDDASAYNDGTGIVYIPAGVYSITRLNAKSNIEIYLEGGSVLRGTGNPQDYNEYAPGGGIDYTYCIHAENQSNIKIWGPGTIDGNGISLTGLTSTDTQPDDINNAIMKIRALSIHNCSNITVSNIIARECSSWTLSFYDSDHIDVQHSKVINERVLKHNDGINLSACQHGRVKNCFVLTSDDAICAKGTKDNNEDCYDIRFEDIVVYSNTRGVKCGMQAYRHMYDIWFKNIDVINARYGIDLLHQDGSGLWEDIHFIDIRVEKLSYFVPASPAPIQMSVDGGGPIHNVEITNCSFEGWGEKNSKIEGHIHGEISNIIFTNLKIGGEFIYNAEQARMNLNAFTRNIIFQVGEFDTIVFPPIEEIKEVCFSFEAEDFSDQEMFAPFYVREDPLACGGKYIECEETRNEPGDDGRIRYEFNIDERSSFVIWFRVIAHDPTDDSFWVSMNGEDYKFNNIQLSTTWIWDMVKDSDTGTDPLIFDLQPGKHTLEIIRRESYTKLDKVYITNLIYSAPEGCETCEITSSNIIQNELKIPNKELIVNQNPVSHFLKLNTDLNFPGILKIFDLQGREIKVFKINDAVPLDISDMEFGVYILSYIDWQDRINQKIILK